MYNMAGDVVRWCGGAAGQVAKGRFGMPRNYEFGISKKS
jgi:hypothetical protein